MQLKTKLLKAQIYHKRYAPKIYDFMHKSFFIFMDIDFINENPKRKFFSLNSLNLFSLYFKDYGHKKFQNPKEYILGILTDHKIDISKIDKIFLLTMPRIFGYVFNPVSFWLCFNNDGKLILSIAEVNNTFGEKHSYLCFKDDLEPFSPEDIVTKNKIFHVSPFFEVKGKYDFRYKIEQRKIKITINYKESDKLSLSTYIDGNFEDFTDKNIIKYIFIYNFMTIKVIILIHYHAIRLWIKKIKFFRKPIKPTKDIS
jgi:DUF1365 family protein